MKTTSKIYGSIEGKLIITNPIKFFFGLGGLAIINNVDSEIVRCDFPRDLKKCSQNQVGKKVYLFGLISSYYHGDKISIKVLELKKLGENYASNKFF